MISPSPTFASKAKTILSAVLQRVLTEESQLVASTRAYSWVVRGSALMSIKRLFGEQQRQIEGWLAETTKFASAIGVAPVAAPSGETEAPEMDVGTIIRQHETIARELRIAVETLREKDPQSDATLLLAGLLEFHETSAWILRLLLQSPERGPLR